MKKPWWILAGALLLPLLCLYTLDAREVAVVTSFGAPVGSVVEPGLHFRIPWPVQEVVRFDARNRVLEIEATEMLTHDKKNLVVEMFAVWRVADPQRFLESAGSMETAEGQLRDLVVSRVAGAIGQLDFQSLLAVSGGGAELLPESVGKDVAQIAADRFGVAVTDLRLKGLGLPLQNEQSIYERMRAERTRIANAYRSEGEEQATTIRAAADRQAAELLSTADKDAALIVAEAESEVALRYAAAYRADPALFRYWSAMESYKATIGAGQTTVYLDGDNGFFSAMAAP